MAAKKKNLQTVEPSIDLLPATALDDINIVWGETFYSAVKGASFCIPFELYDHLAGRGKIAGVTEITEVN